MQLLELFSRLSYGELSNLAIAKDGIGEIEVAQHPKLIYYVNEALVQLFSRFLLKDNDLIIETQNHITNYPLRIRYAESAQNPQNEVQYPFIKDLVNDPFEGDVIKILEVFDRERGKLPLNDKDNPLSLFTPQPDVLQVPSPADKGVLGVLYQARHPKLVLEGDIILEQEIEIPFFLEGALQSFVAHKVFSHMNGQENMLKSSEHKATYEEICVRVELNDLVNTTYHTSHTKLEQRGFV